MLIAKRTPAYAQDLPEARLRALGCHIYAGGFSIGVRLAGFRLMGHLEEWPFGVETAKKNLGVKVWQGLDTWDRAVEKHAGRIDWLYGNPPCASWSVAGYKQHSEEKSAKRWHKDDRTKCTERLFALVPRIEPTVFSWECVAAVMRNGREFVDTRAEEMTELGYRVYLVLFDAWDTGLPQRRTRFFFVASKVRLKFEQPAIEAPTVRSVIEGFEDDPGDGLKAPTYIEDILKRMKPNVTRQLYREYDELWERRGKEPPRNPKTGNRMGRPAYLQVRIGYDKPAARTITGGPAYFHPVENRPLTFREQAGLCGWPRGWDWRPAGSLHKQYQEVGKAVTPPAAEWLARIVRAGLERGAEATPRVVLKNYLTGRGSAV